MLVWVPYGGLLAIYPDCYHLGRTGRGDAQAQSILIEAHEKAATRASSALPSELDIPVAALISDMCHPILESREALARKGYSTTFLLDR